MRNVKANRPASAALAILLLIAQTGALAHAYEHEPGSPQDQVCSTCVAGQALGSACVDSPPHFETPGSSSNASAHQFAAFATVDVPLARQRAPPTPL